MIHALSQTALGFSVALEMKVNEFVLHVARMIGHAKCLHWTWTRDPILTTSKLSQWQALKKPAYAVLHIYDVLSMYYNGYRRREVKQ